jgi:hypothetical protein
MNFISWIFMDGLPSHEDGLESTSFIKMELK